MRAQKRRVTARPKPTSNDVGFSDPVEEGMSIDPEEMGQSFLRYATSGGTGEDNASNMTPPTSLIDQHEDELDDMTPRRGVTEVDLTESVIEEASLLDDESDVLGEVIPKEPRTEDGGHHRSRKR
jgi:hypothetical protein